MSTQSTARDAILARVGRSLGVDEAARCARKKAAADWQKARACDGGGIRPERATRNGVDRQAQFVAEARRSRSDVVEIDGLEALPPAVVAYMRAQDVGGVVRIAPHPDLLGLGWADAGAHEVGFGRAMPGDVISVVLAVAAVAETGSVAFVSGPESPVTLHVLPLYHVSVVYGSRIDAGHEAAMARARAAYGPETAGMPRHLNIITGPSRTADIEQTLLMGAHGPRGELVVVVRDR